jgi:hypothetical protein
MFGAGFQSQIGKQGNEETPPIKSMVKGETNSDMGAQLEVPSIVHNVLHSLGQPLVPSTRQFMETGFGHDFSQVRIHTNQQAAVSARAVNARAYTVGHDIVFGPGQYMPNTQATWWLLAHELAHTIQQNRNSRYLQRFDPEQSLFDIPTCTHRVDIFSVDRDNYLQMVNQAIQQMGGQFLAVETLTGFIQPILHTMVAQVIWQDEHGNTQYGGSDVQVPLPGMPPVTLNLRLILNDQPQPQQGGEFVPEESTRRGTIVAFIRDNPDVNSLTNTLFHEALHMMVWIIHSFGATRVHSNMLRTRRAIGALDVSRFGSQRSVLRAHLDALRMFVNTKRGNDDQIDDANLDEVARWLLEEVLVRAETEVFQLALQVERSQAEREAIMFQETPRRVEEGGGGSVAEVDQIMVDRYIFEYSQVFRPGDRDEGYYVQDILRTITQFLASFFEERVSSRFSTSPYQR